MLQEAKILIAIGGIENGTKLKNLLVNEGYGLVSVCSSGNEALRRLMVNVPDVLITNYHLPDITGVTLCETAQGYMSNIILLANQNEREFVPQDLDVFTLSKPINKLILLNTINLLLKVNNKIDKLKTEVTTLSQKLDERKLLDIAKGILIDKYGLSEYEAHRSIQKRSMDSGIKLVEIAKSIIEEA